MLRTLEKLPEIVDKIEKPNIVVLSAMSGVTNSLQKIADLLKVQSLGRGLNWNCHFGEQVQRRNFKEFYEQNESFYKANTMLIIK